jgi:hypothetical protein
VNEKKPIFDNIKWGEVFPNVLATGSINTLVMSLPIEDRYKFIILIVYNMANFFYGFMRNPKKLDWDYAKDGFDSAAKLAEYQARKRAEMEERVATRDRSDEI